MAQRSSVVSTFVCAVVVAIGLMAVGLPAVAAADPMSACEALKGIEIPAARISLPTRGATVTAASLAAPDPSKSNVEFCKVLGSIRPVDPAAPEIRFQVNLPTQWNGKAVQMGGGGYNGRIPDATGWPSHGLKSAPTPLARGYMTLSDDSGHQAPNANDAQFAANDESLANFGYMHIKKTLDAAKAIAQRRYGKPLRRAYFAGGSTGGREGLTAALRWPDAYDGVISNYPTANFLGLRMQNAALGRAIYADDSAGWIPPAMLDRITSESLAECDPLDGVVDGLVSNMAACRAGSAARLKTWSCAQSAAPCLTPIQVERTITLYHEGHTTNWQPADNRNGFKGYNILEGVEMDLGDQAEFRQPLVEGPNAHAALRADQFLKFFVTRDPTFDLRKFDVHAPGPIGPRLLQVSTIVGATSPDLRAFARHGGKLLLMHGDDDPLVSPYENIRRYQAIVDFMGAPAARAFSRFYLVPGQGHGGGKFQATWDNLDVLDAWVERGVAPPATPVVVDANPKTAGRSRPLCEYPKWPKYKGAGDVNLAASFSCAD